MRSLPSLSPGRTALCLALALQVLVAGLAAAQSTPFWNRSVDEITVYRDADGDPVIFVPVHLEVSNPGTIFDLSTTMSVSINGAAVGDITWDVLSDNPTQSCDFNCGSDCGPLYVDGVINTMLCHETDPADCNCGYWFTAEFPGDGLDEGDVIIVSVAAASGALADTDTSDDLLRHEYPGEPSGWNRRLAGIAIQETSVPGTYDVTALIDMRGDRTSSYLDLSTDVQVSVNGDTEPPLAGVTVYFDSNSGDCETGCGSGCGGMYVDGVFNTMTCRLDGPGDCDCGHWIKANIPGVELQPEDEIMVLLRPAPGALPEPDTSDDDGRVVFSGEEIGWGREIKAVAVVPAGTNGNSAVHVASQLVTDGLLRGTDLSSAVDLRLVQSGGVDASLAFGWSVFGFNEVDCEFGCGPDCGPMYLDGVFNTQTCRLDGPGDCDCGYWLMAPGGEFEFGEDPVVQITALASAGPGGAPDADPAGSAPWTTTFDGSPIGWNRALADVRLVPGSAGDWTVEVDYSVAMANIGQFQDMSCEVELLIDGVPLVSRIQSLGYEPDTGGDNCEVDCSGGSCGAFNTDPGTWIAAACAPWPGFVGCSCGAILSLEIPGVVIPAGATLGVILRPAPGALPELPGFEEDDRREIPDASTGVGDTVVGAPVGLAQNHPNPFNPTTTIEFRTTLAGPVTLDVFDAQGSLVRRLVDETRDAGAHAVVWDGRDGDGRVAASGHYFYRLASPHGVETRKMSLIK